jgi:tRNA (cytidine56-2'-O)-methyltransferase
VGLVSRALGADKFVLVGDDKVPIDTITDVVSKWGGNFKCELIKNWRSYLKNFSGIKIHLSMYGEPYKDSVKKIPKEKDLLIFVGAEKVPKDVYELCDFNIAVTNQPHSEIGALAVFLDRLNIDTKNKFDGAKLKVQPKKKGKSVVKLY